MRPLVVCLSGPDGAGKSTAALALKRALRQRGWDVALTYGYGCLLCRHTRTTPNRTAGSSQNSARGRSLATLHVLLDIAELRLRMALARRRLSAREHPAIVVDRGPLDTLVKFDGMLTRLAERVLARAIEDCGTTILLHAAPEVLVGRDGEHSEPSLALLRERYLIEAARRTDAIPIDTSSCSAAAVTDRILAAIGRPRRRVVLSIFDDVTNPFYAGGGALVVARIAERLAEDYEVTVVTGGRRAGRETRGRVRYLSLPVLWAGPRAGQLAFHALLPLVAGRIAHDVWIDSFTPPFSASLLPAVSRTPVIGLAQALSATGMAARYHLPLVPLESRGLREYADIVVLNEHDEREIQRRASQVRLHLIPNGVDLPADDPAAIGGGSYALFLGRIAIEEKGLDLLLAAHRAARSPLPLLIAGAGTAKEQQRLQALLSAPDPGGAVHWLGRVDGRRKEDLLAGCAFLVLPSRHESFGLSALEAMAHGKPVIHFDLPALRWMDGDVRVAPLSVSGLAETMRALATDERRRAELGRRALGRAGAYTWDATGDAYLALVRQLVEPPPTAKSEAAK